VSSLAHAVRRIIQGPSGRADDEEHDTPRHGEEDDTPRHGEGRPEDAERSPEDDPREPGAEGGSSSTDVDAPFEPNEDDDSPLGDTDQHSDA